MFGNRNIKVILILSLLAIWSLVAYRVINGTSSNKMKIKPIINQIKNESPLKEDTFSLLINYPDPFIPDTSQLYDEPKYTTKTERSDTLKISINFIQFVGIIRNPTKKINLAIVSIYGKEYLVKEGKKLEGITFNKIEKNKINLVYKSQTFNLFKISK